MNLNVYELIEKKNCLEAQLRAMPPGSLLMRGRYAYIQFSDANGKQRQRYVRREDITRVQNQYNAKADLLRRLRGICAELQQFSPAERSKASLAYSEKQKARQIADAHPYGSHRKHLTIHGEYVASKSELALADYLFLHHIHYDYEKPLKLGRKTYYPDFTLYVHDTIIYVEYLGMLHNTQYCFNNKIKLMQYQNHGIIEGFNLLCFREHDGILDMQHIDNCFRSWGIIEKDWDKIVAKRQNHIAKLKQQRHSSS